MVADALSRINSVEKDDQHKEGINFEKLAHAQEASVEMASYHTATRGSNNSLIIVRIFGTRGLHSFDQWFGLDFDFELEGKKNVYK